MNWNYVWHGPIGNTNREASKLMSLKRGRDEQKICYHSRTTLESLFLISNCNSFQALVECFLCLMSFIDYVSTTNSRLIQIVQLFCFYTPFAVNAFLLPALPNTHTMTLDGSIYERLYRELRERRSEMKQSDFFFRFVSLMANKSGCDRDVSEQKRAPSP